MSPFRDFSHLFTVTALTLVGTLCTANAQSDNSTDAKGAAVQSILPESVITWIDTRASERLMEDKSPSISLGIVLDGELVYQAGYGEIAIGAAVAPTPETTFQIASVTKTFVGTLAAKMAADGRVDLDVPVTDYLPELTLHETAQNEPITLRVLLSHQSGLVYPNNADFQRAPGMPDGFDIWMAPIVSVEELIEGMATTPSRYPVGDRYAYSGVGIILAAHALAQAGGYTNFEAALKEELLEPLGMTDTFVRSSDERDASSATAYAFTNNKYDKICPLGTEEYYEMPLQTYGTAVGSSGLTSTTHDLGSYLGAIMGEGEILSADAKEMLFTPNVEFLYSDELVYQIGLGWRMGQFGTYGTVYSHTGYNTGHHASVLVSDEHDIGVIALTNGSYTANRRLAADVMLKLLQRTRSHG